MVYNVHITVIVFSVYNVHITVSVCSVYNVHITVCVCVCAHNTTAFTRTLKQVASSGINNTLAQKRLVSLKIPPRLYFMSYTSENLICYRRPHSTSMCVEIFRKY